MKKSGMLKVIMWGIVIMLIPVLIYLIIDMGDAKDIMKAYMSLTPDNSSSFSKSNIFLKTYTLQTGDITLAEALGLSKEDVQDLGGDGGGDDGGGEGTTTPWTDDNIDSAIAAHCKSWGGYNTDNWDTQKINGNYYPRQIQYKSLFSGVKNVEGESIKGAGCMWYAMQTVVTSKSGEIWGIEDLLSKVGYTVTYSGGVMITDKKLPCVGIDTSKIYADGKTRTTPEAVLNATGKVKCSTDYKNDSSKIDTSKICLVHIKDELEPRQMSSGGQHWFLIVGESGDNYVLANAPSKQVSKATLHKYLNHLYIIE